MRVSAMRLRNFRSHTFTDIDFERVNYVRGLNKVGKSALAMAIEIAISGRCDVTDEAGKGHEELIREGEQRAQIEIAGVTSSAEAFHVLLTLDRTAGRSWKITSRGIDYSGRNAQEWLATHIAPPDVVNVCLNAWRFMDLDESDQADLLARVLLPEKLDLDDTVADWLRNNKLSIVERGSLFATIEATQKNIAAARTEANRKLRDLKNIDEPPPVKGDREKLRVEIDDMQRQQAELNARRIKFETARATQHASREHAATLRTRITDDEKVIADLSVKVLTDERVAELKKAASLVKRQKQLRTEVAAFEASLQIVLGMKERAVVAVGETGICPTCNQSLSDAAKQFMLKPIEAEEDRLSKEIVTRQKELRGMKDDGDEAKTALQENLRIATEIARRGETLDQEKAKLAEIEAAQGQAGNAEAQSDEEREIVAKLDEMKPKLAEKLDALVALVRAEERVAEYKAKLAERARIAERVAELERLLEYFGPKGIKAKLVAERLDTFVERLNRVMRQWGYFVTFAIEPFALRVIEGAGKPLKPRQLSASERYRLGIAFACAIADWTGLRMLIADGADILDRDDKRILAEMLETSDLDQAIVTSTGIAGTFEADETAFYTLYKTDGVTEVRQDPVGASTGA